MKKILSATLAVVMGAFSVSAAATAQDTGTDLDTLLRQVKNGKVTETQRYKDRVSSFISRRDQQRTELNRANARKNALDAETDRLSKQIADLEQQIVTLEDRLTKEKGKLGELFGVLQQAAGDAKGTIKGSHITIEYPEREAGIDLLVEKAKDTAQLPTTDEIRAWPYAMMIEMQQSSEVVTFDKEVQLVDGTSEVVKLTRIGDFGFLANNKYFYLTDAGKVEELPRQPSDRILGTVPAYMNASSGSLVNVGVDPTRGVILSMEVQKATLQDQLEAGGEVGYLILALGAVGAFLAVVQFIYLFFVKMKVKSQIKNTTPNENNPLGRVLKVYADNPNVDVETLELKLDEAILKETPALERFLSLIKLISAVAPLFGLLGTVTGMIATFQAITLFGTGDPTMMASGISMALVTTVEGLVVAIPTLLLHSFVAGASKSVIHILEEQSAGIIAVHAEKENANASA